MAVTQAEKVAGARNFETVRVWITKAVRWTRERLNLRPWITGAALFCFLLAAVILLLAAAHGWVPPPTNEGQAARCYSDFQHAKLPMSLGCVMASHETLAGGLIDQPPLGADQGGPQHGGDLRRAIAESW
jgi:hypothetical protein